MNAWKYNFVELATDNLNRIVELKLNDKPMTDKFRQVHTSKFLNYMGQRGWELISFERQRYRGQSIDFVCLLVFKKAVAAQS
jgi:hypothetical protein